MTTPSVGIIMGSHSDWATMKYAADILGDFGVVCETRIISAHRTPDLLFEYAEMAKMLNGIDSLLSIVQMPRGIPVGTLAIGEAGALNAGLLAAAILALHDPALAVKLDAYRAAQTQRVLDERLP